MVQKIKLYKYSVDLFLKTLSEITKLNHDNYKCNDADVKSWNSFCEYYGCNVGQFFIKDFIEYQFQSWFNDGTEKDYSRTIRFSWVVGKSAIKRWEALSAKTNVYLTRKFLKQSYKINKNLYKSSIGEFITEINPNEEKFKVQFFDTKRGLIWCIANTTLFNHKSSNCIVCSYKEECKQILKEQYKKVYKARGYER